MTRLSLLSPLGFICFWNQKQIFLQETSATGISLERKIFLLLLLLPLFCETSPLFWETPAVLRGNFPKKETSLPVCPLPAKRGLTIRSTFLVQLTFSCIFFLFIIIFLFIFIPCLKFLAPPRHRPLRPGPVPW